jgi:hypothetical protein
MFRRAGKYLPPWGEGEISSDINWGKKCEKAKRKRGKIEKKGRKGKENEKRGSKRVRYMQNREELRQKGHDGS